MNEQQRNGPFPAELLVSIFSYLDGPTLACCSQTCRQWNMILTRFDQKIWPYACRMDFERSHARRFWSLQFPSPTQQKSWQDMYRITRNWYKGCVGTSYPTTVKTSSLEPCTVIGVPQEQGIFTNLTLASEGRVIRSNPNYHSPTGSSQMLMVQSPQTKRRFYLEGTSDKAPHHSIVCHYTHPSSKWLVTGALNGTVALWDLTTISLVRMWNGHRGRVLCISMDGEAVVSGGSDSMIRVWDLHKEAKERTQRPTRRGMIDISSYLSGRNDWYQGVGEIALNGHLVACAPDASGPLLVFSLLTGSLVYELRVPDQPEHIEWGTEDITAFTRLVLTPFFLLTKGKIHHHQKQTIKLVPSHNVVTQRTQQQQETTTKAGYIATTTTTTTPPPHAAQMTPYQLYQYYSSVNNDESHTMPTTSACINVWNLQTGKIAYRLVPILDTPEQHYTLTDIRVSQDFSKVFASIEIRGQKQYQEKLFCWDFNVNYSNQPHEHMDIIELDRIDPTQRKTGASWVCFM